VEHLRHDGRETAYRATGGDGPPIVYVHGSGATSRAWVHQYGPERPGGAGAAAVDLSGHGDSEDVDAPAGQAALDAYADDVCAVARAVWADAAGPRVLAGNSLGGAVVLWIALERDLDADGLVLCGTGAKLGVADPLADALAGEFERAIELLHGEDMLFHDPDPGTREASVEGMRATGRAVTERDFLTCDEFDVRDRLSAVTTPALAVTGEHDRLTPPSFHEYLAGELPDCELSLVAEAAHLSFLERPAAWSERVGTFRDRL
jgi:pimeloyl-ACP methyl ester carboxylesterase